MNRFIPNLLLPRRLAFFVMLLLVGILQLNAANLYVAKTGNDANAGTSAGSPFLTIKKAVNTAVSGDVIYIGDGAYVDSIRLTKSLTFVVDSVQLSVLHLNTAGVKLTVNGTGTYKSFNIKDSLVLNNGIVVVNSSLNAFRALSTCSIKGGNNNSFVDGRLYVGKTNGVMDITYPIGKGSTYRPVRLTFTKSDGTLTYYYFDFQTGTASSPGALPAGIRNYSSVDYYQSGILPTGALNSSSFQVTLNYDSIVNLDDRVYDKANLRVIGYPTAGSWASYGPTTGGSANRKGTVVTTAGSVSKLGVFTLANAYTLTTTERKSGTNTLGSDSVYAAWKISAGRCTNDSIRFQDLSRSVTSTIQSYNWNFGDPTSLSNTSILRNPAHKFTSAGTFRVSLVVLNAGGYLDSWVEFITVNQSPIIVRTIPKICFGEAAVFLDNSIAPTISDIASWSWDMGDGPPSTKYTTRNVTHTYLQAGVFKIMEYVTAKNGCVTKDTFDFVVHNKPAVDFSASDVCLGMQNVFVDNSTVDAPDKVKSRTWYMGDGQTFVGITALQYKTITKKYAAAGLYQVKEIVYSDFQGTKGYCRDSLTKTVRVYQLPTVKYEQSKTCFEETTIFTDKSYVDPADFAKAYSWAFGDASFDTTMYGASHKYMAAGAYKTRLTITSNAGCVNSDTLTVYVDPKPKADFTAKAVCFGDSTVLTHIPTPGIPDTKIKQYTWKVDTIYNYFTPDAKHGFAAPGTYQVKLYVETQKFCRDSMEQKVKSYYKPQIYFDLDKTITPNDSQQCWKYNNFYFNKVATIDPNDTLLNTMWSWGDGQTEMPANSINHHFDSVKIYTVKLYGISINGCADSIERKYEIKPSPIAKFYYVGDCVPDSVGFFDTATVSVRPITQRTWVIEGTEYKNLNPPFKYYYATGGAQSVSYVVVNDTGCADTQIQNFSLTQKPVLNILFSGSMPLCLGDSIAVSISGADTITWLHDTSHLANRNFYGKGWYKIAGKTGNCTAIDSIFVQAFPPSKINAFNDTTIYRGTYAKLWTDGVANFKWTPKAFVLIDTLKVVQVRPLDTTMFYVSTVDTNGCASVDSVKVKVIDPPLVRIPNLITPNGDGENEFWDLTELRQYWMYDITLSDRQGKRVFFTSNYKNDWSALDADGGEMPVGVYFYYMKHQITGEEYRGYIQVMR